MIGAILEPTGGREPNFLSIFVGILSGTYRLEGQAGQAVFHPEIWVIFQSEITGIKLNKFYIRDRSFFAKNLCSGAS